MLLPVPHSVPHNDLPALKPWNRPSILALISDASAATMSHVTYAVVEHDGGRAYKVGDVFSETFAARVEADRATGRAAQEQRAPGEGGPIEYEDGSGRWHEEQAQVQKLSIVGARTPLPLSAAGQKKLLKPLPLVVSNPVALPSRSSKICGESDSRSSSESHVP
jgi:hypothetical protein